MKRLALLILLASIGCSGCASVNAQWSPSEDLNKKREDILRRDIAWILDTIPIQRFNTPYVYGMWRVMVERCSGVSRPDWPTFYTAPINPLPTPDGPALAYYSRDDEVIVFALGTMQERAIVMHETLHFLLKDKIERWKDSDPDSVRRAKAHPSEYFGPTGKCAHILNPPS